MRDTFSSNLKAITRGERHDKSRTSENRSLAIKEKGVEKGVEPIIHLTRLGRPRLPVGTA